LSLNEYFYLLVGAATVIGIVACLLPDMKKSDGNRFAVGVVSFEALGDRVIVEEDPFVSGYECRDCGGRGWNTCGECNEGKSRINPEITCKSCEGTTRLTCATCGGRGGLLVVPQKSERRPTTGKLVTIGDEVNLWYKFWLRKYRLQDRVMYGSFSGHVVDLDNKGEKVILRVMHRSEILCRVTGHLSYRHGD
jgi:co-chaperonin GroES (HSP10)